MNYNHKKHMQLLEDFHTLFDKGDDDEARRQRGKLIKEEYKEVMEALEEERPFDIKHLSKEIADLAYVLYGTAYLFGIDLDKAIQLVHESNMSKTDDQGRPAYGESGKPIKTGNYFEPDMSSSIVRDYRERSYIKNAALVARSNSLGDKYVEVWRKPKELKPTKKNNNPSGLYLGFIVSSKDKSLVERINLDDNTKPTIEKLYEEGKRIISNEEIA